jgi:predicted phage tail protein
MLGFAYAGVDQLRNDPPEWGKGWHGYGRRLASDVGEFTIQETVTEGLAAAMNRPLDYQRCRCRPIGSRVAWALASSLTDPLPHGHRALAVPRIVGAYAGSFAQASWRPATTTGRTTTALINGSVSLLVGAGINLFYELRPHR